MKKVIPIVLVLIIVTAIIFFIKSREKKDEPEVQKNMPKNKYVSLYKDTINVVRLSDTLVIYESTCRGCAYENSTSFDISDSLHIVRLQRIVTTDNNSDDMAGGSISKDLILLPMNTGTTTIRLYKFWKEPATAADSANFIPYTIEVRN